HRFPARIFAGLRACSARPARPACARAAGLHPHVHARHRMGRRVRRFTDAARARPRKRTGLDRPDQAALRAHPEGDLRMNLVLYWAASFALLCFVLGMACGTVRLVRGPTAQDRVLALDSLYINGMLAMLAFGVRSGTSVYFDVALL